MFCYEDGFGYKLPTNCDMPLKKETKPNQTKPSLYLGMNNTRFRCWNIYNYHSNQQKLKDSSD